MADKIKIGCKDLYSVVVPGIPYRHLVAAYYSYNNSRNQSYFTLLSTVLQNRWLESRCVADHLIRYTRNGTRIQAFYLFDELCVERCVGQGGQHIVDSDALVSSIEKARQAYKC